MTNVSRREFVRSGIGLFGLPLTLGCEQPLDPPSGDPRLTARPGAPSTAPTLGMTALGLGQGRDGFLYVPQSYSAATSWPLVVLMHGAGGAASNWGSFASRAEARGLILLAPDSRGVTWDLLSRGFGPDVAFLDLALAHTFERCNIAADRVALAGFSDGASYALSLGVSNGDLFSHLVGWSPGFHAPADPIIGRPFIFISHGTQDAILSFSRTRDRIVPTLRSAGYQVTFRQFDGPHTLPGEIVDETLEWFGAG